MRRIFLLLTVITLVFLTSCGDDEGSERLAYQNSRLYIEGTFTLDGDSFPVTLQIEPPEYDDAGRMLAREATLSFGENSIISGVSFGFSAGGVYIAAGEMRIPVEDADTVSGISDIISLFCISKECYYQSERIRIDKLECERILYVDGDNRVEVILDLSCKLPKSITATVGERTIAADISFIKAE